MECNSFYTDMTLYMSAASLLLFEPGYSNIVFIEVWDKNVVFFHDKHDQIHIN